MTTVAVGLVRDLPCKRVMRAQVAGQDLVIWRASDGQIAAWDNRCPHRGMALSHGFVRGNDLACLYHGWHYGKSGVCRYIPAHPDLTPPQTIHTQRVSVLEQDGVIWVNTRGPATPPSLPMACAPLRSFIAEADAGRFQSVCATTEFAGDVPEPLGRGVYRLGRMRVVLLENPLGEGRTQITVVMQAKTETAQAAALSRWCEALRRRASQAAMARA